MQIQTSRQMLQHIDNGGHIQLNSNNQVEKQGFFSHMMQSIGDAFRSLSSSGRAAITARNTALLDAMTRLVAQEGPQAPVNPAGELIQSAVTPRQRMKMAARLVAGRAVTENLPPEMQKNGIAFVSASLNGLARAGQLGTDGLTAKAAELCKQIKNTSVLAQLCSCDATVPDEEMRSRISGYKEMMISNIPVTEKDVAKQLTASGMHTIYPGDVGRGSVSSINGHTALPSELEGLPADPEKRAAIYEKQLTDAFQGRDKRYVTLVSTLVSQQGISRALSADLLGGKMRVPPLGELAMEGVGTKLVNHHSDITVQDNKVHITYNTDLRASLMSTGDVNLMDEPMVTGRHYTVDIEIDLNQDLGDKVCPDFTITDIRNSPLEEE